MGLLKTKWQVPLGLYHSQARGRSKGFAPIAGLMASKYMPPSPAIALCPSEPGDPGDPRRQLASLPVCRYCLMTVPEGF